MFLVLPAPYSIFRLSLVSRLTPRLLSTYKSPYISSPRRLRSSLTLPSLPLLCRHPMRFRASYHHRAQSCEPTFSSFLFVGSRSHHFILYIINFLFLFIMFFFVSIISFISSLFFSFFLLCDAKKPSVCLLSSPYFLPGLCLYSGFGFWWDKKGVYKRKGWAAEKDKKKKPKKL